MQSCSGSQNVRSQSDRAKWHSDLFIPVELVKNKKAAEKFSVALCCQRHLIRLALFDP